VAFPMISSSRGDGRTSSPLWHLQELLRYRSLVWNLVLRDLKTRYKRSVLGFLWSLLNPLGMMLVFTLVFTVIMPSQIKNYPIFLLCGLLPWNFFTGALMLSINSVAGNANLVKKVYFPREALPVSSVLSALVNFLLGMAVLMVVLIVTGSRFSHCLWLLPFVIAIQTCFTLGVALFLSAINVYYRDTLMIMDVVLLAWFFLTPVVYSIAILPSSYEIMGITVNPQRLMYILNPMASLIAAYRDLLYWGYRTDLDFFLRTAVTSIAVLVLGYWYFTRHSHDFGEKV
jgi:lipopolysaccharide transport system permease protein